MIDLDQLKNAVAQRDAIKGHLSYHDVEELISALEEAKEIAQGEDSNNTYGCMQEWLAKYFQDKGE